MTKSTKQTDDAVTTAAERGPKLAAHATDSDTARRAYDLYLARGCEHGHDLHDWLRAQRELRKSPPSIAA